MSEPNEQDSSKHLIFLLNWLEGDLHLLHIFVMFPILLPLQLFQTSSLSCEYQKQPEVPYSALPSVNEGTGEHLVAAACLSPRLRVCIHSSAWRMPLSSLSTNPSYFNSCKHCWWDCYSFRSCLHSNQPFKRCNVTPWHQEPVLAQPSREHHSFVL